MDLSKIESLTQSIKSIFDKRNALAVSFEKSFKNRKMVFFSSLFIYLFILTITPPTVLVWINHDYLDGFITNKTISYIIKSVLLLMNVGLFAWIFNRIIKVSLYFSSKSFQIVKKEIYKNGIELYPDTIHAHKKFKKQRIICYCIEVIIPFFIIVFITIMMYNYSLYYLIASILLIVLCSFSIALFYEKEHSIKFYIATVADKIDNKVLVNRELIKIDNLSYYISNKEENIYLYDNDKWFLFKQKPSDFVKEDIFLYKTYLEEHIGLWEKFAHSNECKDKNSAYAYIKEVKQIIDDLNELL